MQCSHLMCMIVSALCKPASTSTGLTIPKKLKSEYIRVYEEWKQAAEACEKIEKAMVLREYLDSTPKTAR